MTPHGIVTRAALADAEELDRNLRPEDRAELEDISGASALDCLRRSVLFGDPAYTLRTHSGELVGIVSVAPVSYLHGAIAMSGTPAIERVSTAFLRGSRDVLADIERRFDTLLNVCDARNEVHHRWLKWLGFTFIRKIDSFGPRGVPVYEFARISNQHV